MIKNRLAGGIAALMLTAATLAPSFASAHEAVSPLNNKSTSPFLAVHLSPNLASWVYVGWDPNGVYINTTTSVSATPATYRIRSWDRCLFGFAFATSPLVTVNGPNFWVRGSALCAPNALVQGAGGVSQ